MTGMTPEQMATALGKGLLSFPVTNFGKDGRLDADGYRDNISWAISHGPAGLFAAGGTGEFFSLTPNEVATVVEAAVAEVFRWRQGRFYFEEGIISQDQTVNRPWAHLLIDNLQKLDETLELVSV